MAIWSNSLAQSLRKATFAISWRPLAQKNTRLSWPIMKRVVVIGPGASGKSTLAVQLGEVTGLPVIELDKVFWRAGLVATPGDQWAEVQQNLVKEDRWILDGDLGPYDAIEVRLRAADTVIFLDFSLVRCAWRAIRRSRERVDFWLWLLRYRRQGRPFLMKAICDYAHQATLHVLRNPQAVRRFVTDVASSTK
jgi:adenylate kinase family enzyme